MWITHLNMTFTQPSDKTDEIRFSVLRILQRYLESVIDLIPEPHLDQTKANSLHASQLEMYSTRIFEGVQWCRSAYLLHPCVQSALLVRLQIGRILCLYRWFHALFLRLQQRSSTCIRPHLFQGYPRACLTGQLIRRRFSCLPSFK